MHAVPKLQIRFQLQHSRWPKYWRLRLLVLMDVHLNVFYYLFVNYIRNTTAFRVNNNMLQRRVVENHTKTREVWNKKV